MQTNTNTREKTLIFIQLFSILRGVLLFHREKTLQLSSIQSKASQRPVKLFKQSDSDQCDQTIEKDFYGPDFDGPDAL
jgi:hypothetical protein